MFNYDDEERVTHIYYWQCVVFTACGDKQESEQKSGYRIQGDTVYIADPLLLEKSKYQCLN